MPTLRGVNNPTTDLVILSTLGALLPVGTQLAAGSQSGTGAENVYIQNVYKMSLGNFPAIHLSSGAQHYRKNSLRTYMGNIDVEVSYYDRWDQSPTSIDTIRANIAADLERMKSSIETNDSLAYGNQAFAISTPEISLSPYKGEIDATFPGLTLIVRTMSLIINVLPYDC